MFLPSLLIEKFFAGRLRWLIFSVLTATMVAFALHPEIVLRVLNALFQDCSVEGVAVILAGGILSGVFISFFSLFFRMVQMVLQNIISPSG